MEGQQREMGFLGMIAITIVTKNYKTVSYPTFPRQKNKFIPLYEKALKANEF